MSRLNLPQIANRIGRIVFATILAGVFVGGLSLFSVDDGYNTLSGPTEPLDMYLSAMFEIVVIVVAVGLIVPLLTLLYWGLSSRVSWTRKWQLLLGGTVLIATAWTGSGTSGAVDIVVGIAGKTIYGLSILAAISIVELLAATDVDLNPRQLATGTGVLALLFVFLIPTAAITAGFVAEQTAQDPLEKAFDDDGEPYPNYHEVSTEHTSMGDSGSADHLVANASGDQPNLTAEQTYNVSKTHVGPEYFDLRTWRVHDGDETIPVRGHYYLSFEGEGNDTKYYDSVVNTGVAGVETVDTDEFPDASAPRGDSGTFTMEYTESMWLYYDVATEDGEVHRYMVALERSDVTDSDSSD